MNAITSAVHDDDYNIVKVFFDKGATVLIYCGWVEDALNTTVASRSELNWLIDNDPATYAQLVLTGEIQKYLSNNQREYFERCKSTSTEFMMYNKLI